MENTIAQHIKCLFLMAIFCVGCAQTNRTKALLIADGFRDVEVRYAPEACPESEYASSFTAKKDGLPVRGVVCRGWMERSDQIRWGRE